MGMVAVSIAVWYIHKIVPFLTNPSSPPSFAFKEVEEDGWIRWPLIVYPMECTGRLAVMRNSCSRTSAVVISESFCGFRV